MKQRLDQALVDRGLCETRTQAQKRVMAGQVRLNGHSALKSSDTVRAGDQVELLTSDRYVSRGGHKLEHALKFFDVHPSGLCCADIGASTGGFTDCLLQHGALRVHAIDVGHGQLAWRLRQDPRVVVLERTNARHLTSDLFGAEKVFFDLIVADCSFISLRLILPPAVPLLRLGGRILALVKPQFEAGREAVDKGAGVITDPEIHAEVLRDLELFVGLNLPELQWAGVTESPLLGPAGNKEFLAELRKRQ